MNRPRISAAELLLRGLAAGDETMLHSVLVLAPARPGPAPVGAIRALPPTTRSLIRLAALLALNGSATSLRWAVEHASITGAEDEEIVEVLAIVAPMVGSARVVAAAPRLALAIGYDVEIDECDGD